MLKCSQIKVTRKTFGKDGYVYCLDCSDGIVGICIYPNSSNCTYYICAVIYILIIYTSIKLLKKQTKTLVLR